MEWWTTGHTAMVFLAAWIFGEVRWRERWHRRLARLEARVDQCIAMTTRNNMEAQERDAGKPTWPVPPNTTGLPRSGDDIVEAALANAPDMFARARAEQAVIEAAQAEATARAGGGHEFRDGGLELGDGSLCVRCGRFALVGDGGLCAPDDDFDDDPPTNPPKRGAA